MRARLLAALLLAPAAWAQLQINLVSNGNTVPVGTTVNMGQAAVGDSVTFHFQVVNTSTTTAATVVSITVSDPVNFKVVPAPVPPWMPPNTLAPEHWIDFHVSFNPASVNNAPFSAILAVNSTVTTTLTGTAVSAPDVITGSGNLNIGGAVDFGIVQDGANATQTFTLSNSGTAPLTVNSVQVSGSGFSGPAGLTLPLTLQPGDTRTFQILFVASGNGNATGTLNVDGRVFQLRALVASAALPRAAIQFDSQTPASGKQMNVSIALTATSKTAGSGTLTLDFKPASGLPDDPAIGFVSGPLRKASVQINVGDALAHIGGTQVNFAFQTGTTAGTITFSLVLSDGSTAQSSLAIAPATVGFDTANGVRRAGALDVNLRGFDNTHSVSRLSFTFYDTTGTNLTPAGITIDETTDFRKYFDANQAGGAFALQATFPVTGDVSSVAAVDVQMTNSAGTAQTQRITFP